MRKRDVVATVATFGTLICIASEAQDSTRVKEAWGWLRASGLEVHVTCANSYLQALIKEVIVRLYVHMGEGKTGIAEQVQCYSKQLPCSPIETNPNDLNNFILLLL